MRVIVAGLFLLIYGGLIFYIGRNGYQSITSKINISRVLYWSVLIILSSLYFISFFSENILPGGVTKAFQIIGGYWIPAFVYLLALTVLVDIIKLATRKIAPVSEFFKSSSIYITFASFILVCFVLVIGTYNAFVPTIRNYTIDINKHANGLKNIKCAMISDVHMGELIGKDRLIKAVKIINEMQPDIVVIAGDLIDNDIAPIKRENSLEPLKDIKSKYGTFAVLGNHEYYGSTSDEIEKMLSDYNVTVLRDKKVLVADSFYVVGREDKTVNTFGGQRKELQQLTTDIDKSLPVILIDHQPNSLEDARKDKIDLQLSGHTHAGQFFPISIITNAMFEKHWGYLKDNDFNLIVSSGYGTWGPSVRIGSQSEILDININFNPKSQ